MTPAPKKSVGEDEPKERVNIAAFHAILRDSKATGSGRTFLLVLSQWMDNHGSCYAFNGALMKHLGVKTDRAVQLIQNRLVKLGELTIQVGTGPKGSNRYHSPLVEKALQGDPPNKHSGVNKRSGRTDIRGTPNKRSEKGRINVRAKEQTEEFKELVKELVGISLPATTSVTTTTSAAKPAKPGKATRTLWPAPQLAKMPRVAAVLDKHRRWWTAVIEESDELEECSLAESELLEAAVVDTGGLMRFRGFNKNPRAADRARDEFLGFMQRHDPAYEAAIAQVVAESLAEPDRPKAKAARAGRSP
jgi:hypothetical protein